MFGIRWALMVVVAISLPSVAFSQETTEENPTKVDERLSRDTPEGTLRVFTLGVMLGHEQLLKATMLPVSEEDMKVLLQSPNDRELSPSELKEECANMKVVRLEPGDIFTLPDGEDIVVAQEEVNDERMVLVFDDAPTPTRMYQAKGYWWVDADPVIAARKAAAKVREKRQQNTAN